MSKVKTGGSVKFRAYPIIEDAVGCGIALGLRRAYKHSDKALSEHEVDTIVTAATRAVMETLGEVIDWEGA